MNRREFLKKVAKATSIIAAGAAVVSRPRPKLMCGPYVPIQHKRISDEEFWEKFGQHRYTPENMLKPLSADDCVMMANQDTIKMIGKCVTIRTSNGSYIRPNAAWICRKNGV
jgi:hypothetical protein